METKSAGKTVTHYSIGMKTKLAGKTRTYVYDMKTKQMGNCLRWSQRLLSIQWPIIVRQADKACWQNECNTILRYKDNTKELLFYALKTTLAGKTRTSTVWRRGEKSSCSKRQSLLAKRCPIVLEYKDKVKLNAICCLCRDEQISVH